jgi:hypothetical protein
MWLGKQCGVWDLLKDRLWHAPLLLDTAAKDQIADDRSSKRHTGNMMLSVRALAVLDIQQDSSRAMLPVSFM